jgi:hypothetical protein
VGKLENTKILTEAQIEAIEKVAELVRELVDNIVEWVKSAWAIVCRVCKKLLEIYNNKRVLHLATKHGNPRVRKKNLNRIIKWTRRLGRCKE